MKKLLLLSLILPSAVFGGDKISTYIENRFSGLENDAIAKILKDQIGNRQNQISGLPKTDKNKKKIKRHKSKITFLSAVLGQVNKENKQDFTVLTETGQNKPVGILKKQGVENKECYIQEFTIDDDSEQKKVIESKRVTWASGSQLAVDVVAQRRKINNEFLREFDERWKAENRRILGNEARKEISAEDAANSKVIEMRDNKSKMDERRKNAEQMQNALWAQLRENNQIEVKVRGMINDFPELREQVIRKMTVSGPGALQQAHEEYNTVANGNEYALKRAAELRIKIDILEAQEIQRIRDLFARKGAKVQELENRLVNNAEQKATMQTEYDNALILQDLAAAESNLIQNEQDLKVLKVEGEKIKINNNFEITVTENNSQFDVPVEQDRRGELDNLASELSKAAIEEAREEINEELFLLQQNEVQKPASKNTNWKPFMFKTTLGVGACAGLGYFTYKNKDRIVTGADKVTNGLFSQYAAAAWNKVTAMPKFTFTRPQFSGFGSGINFGIFGSRAQSAFVGVSSYVSNLFSNLRR